MLEQITQVFFTAFQHVASVFLNRIVPMIGVGGSVETLETVPPSIIGYGLVVLAGLGVVFGIALAIVASKFMVKMDPKVEQVRETLPGANCGACGFAGCMGYAEAVVGNPDVASNLCAPGKGAVAEKIAQITGKAAAKVDPKIARVFCQGGKSKSQKKFIYTGVMDCTAAVLAAGGDKSCEFGCLGYATCMRACPFDAITMSDDSLPVINPEKCTACGKCVAACPKQVIELAKMSKPVVVSCHSRDKGIDVKKKCQVGCIACGMCVRTCPVDAIKVDNNLARIDHEKCISCGLCVKKCPTNAIHDHFAPRLKASIQADKCAGIDVCAKVCPVNAISGEIKAVHRVDQSKCIGCGMCEARCPKKAIIMVSGGGAHGAEAAKEKAAAAV
ncbi:MAG: Fe-S cluster domain-containing protein [Nitrospirota bacterium]|nr:Fe-S cluster domain-containing protein [Nitrospirota bacterium]